MIINNSTKLSLYKKSQKSGISVDILEEVYRRGYSIWNDSFDGTPEQFAFDRVNSFIAGGFALQLDEDLLENWQDSKYKNPEGGLTKAGVMAYRKEHPGSHLKTAVTTEPSKLKPGSKSANRRKSFCARMSGMKKKLTSSKTANDPDSRINKSLRKWNCEETELDEKMNNPCWKGYKAIGMKKKNGKTVPNCVPTEEYTGAEKTSNNPDKPSNRFKGTKTLVRNYEKVTPGQPVRESTIQCIKRVINEINIRDTAGNPRTLKNVSIRMADGSIKSLPPGKSGSSGGGGKE